MTAGTQASRMATRRSLRQLFRSITTNLTPNRSSRWGAPVKGSVIHTTESGDFSMDAVINYLDRPDVEVSAHYVVDALAPKGEPWVRVVRMVWEREKAWTAKSANPYFVQYELIGRAKRTKEEWLGKYRKQLETTAALVAQDTKQWGFPARHGYPGILGHGDLDEHGFPNDHTDPGPGFPWPQFIAMVKDYRKTLDAPPPVRDAVGGGGGTSTQ